VAVKEADWVEAVEVVVNWEADLEEVVVRVEDLVAVKEAVMVEVEAAAMVGVAAAAMVEVGVAEKEADWEEVAAADLVADLVGVMAVDSEAGLVGDWVVAKAVDWAEDLEAEEMDLEEVVARDKHRIYTFSTTAILPIGN
jgi:hypothetical protein